PGAASASRRMSIGVALGSLGVKRKKLRRRSNSPRVCSRLIVTRRRKAGDRSVIFAFAKTCSVVRATGKGVCDLHSGSARWRMLLCAFALATWACQTTDEAHVLYADSGSAAPLARADDAVQRGPKLPPPSSGGYRSAGTPLLDNSPKTKTTFLEGTGRF